MLFATHMIVAGTVGEAIGNPIAAFFVGIVVHLILDTIPHYDSPDGPDNVTPKQWILAITDALIGIILVIFVFKPEYNFNSSFLWGAFGGVLVDLFDVFPLWKKQFRKSKIGKQVHYIHDKYHANQPSFIVGISTQYFLIILAYMVLKYFRS